VRLKTISRFSKCALEEISASECKRYGIIGNSARDVGRLTFKNKKGFHTWILEEIECFEQRHPLGSKAHLTMTLIIYCGGRRGDVVARGRQHTRNRRLRYTQNKNSRRNPVVVDIASRMMREYPVRFCAGFGVKFPGPTRRLAPLHARLSAGKGDTVLRRIKPLAGPAMGCQERGPAQARSKSVCVSGSAWHSGHPS
jgi:hypothetical protein